MEPRFLRHIKVLSVDISTMNPQPLRDSAGNDLSGSNNNIQISCLKEISLTVTNKDTMVSRKKSDPAVVISTHKWKEAYDFKAAQLLQSTGVQSPFIYSHIHCDNEKKIALAAECDFFSYVTKNSSLTPKFSQLSIDQIKKMMLHMILALSALHSKGLIHRDIKLENFLVFLDAYGNPIVKLADLDDVAVATVIDSTFPVVGTLFPNANEITKHHQMQDKKWLDCYAMGRTLEDIAGQHTTLYNDVSFRDLYIGLKNGTLTIIDAKNHAFFGTPPGQLADNVLAEHNGDIIELDNMPVPSYPVVGDSTLMNHCINLAYRRAKQMDHVLSKTTTLENLPSESVTKLHQDASHFLDESYKRSNPAILNNNAMFKESHRLLKETSMARYQHLTTADLQKAVANAAKEYQEFHRKKGSWNVSGFFCFHGQTGIQRAEDFSIEIAKMVEQSKTLAEVHNRILKHFESGEGNWSSYSFKTFLMKHLDKISILPFHEWRGPSKAPIEMKVLSQPPADIKKPSVP